MDNTIDHTLESANRVYSKEGIAPTIPTCGGGGIQPKVLECKVIGGFGEKKSNNGTQWYQQDRVYDIADVSPRIPAQIPGGSYRFMDIEQVQIVAMRGRENGQQLEPRADECTNTITTVEKDNYVLVKQATKDGYIPCDIGGGMRSELPRQYNTQRSSARERTDMSNANNGEYP